MKKIWYIVGILFIAFIAFQFVNLKSCNSDVVFNPREVKHKFLFNENTIERIKPKYGTDNKNLNSWYYQYEVHDIIVIEIKGFKNINVSDLSLRQTNNYYNLSIFPSLNQPYKDYEIISKPGELNADSIELITNWDAEILNELKTNEIFYLNIKSKGISISNKKEEPLIMFHSKISNHYNFCFVKNDGRFYLVILTQSKSNEATGDLLIDLLNEDFTKNENEKGNAP